MYEYKLKSICESNGVQATTQALSDAIAEKKLNPSRLSIRRLAEAFCGHNFEENLTRFKTGAVLESGEAVSASAFTAITGQLLVNEIKDKYELQAMVADQLCSTVPVVNGNLGEQKVPYLSDVIDTGATLEEGEPYPQTKFKGQYITYPAITKKGQICAVTMEAIYSDLTTQILDSARSVGTYLGLAKMYDILKVVAGVTNNHSWNGTSYNTYQASSPWINQIGTFSLTDWTSVNSLEQLFYQMTDPVTGQPIEIQAKTMLVNPALKYQARTILNASEVTRGNFATTGNPIRFGAQNPLDSDYELLATQYLRKVLIDSGVSASNSDQYVFLGDFKKAFVWREVKPLTVVEAPPLNPLDFNQDIALAVKAMWQGVAGVRDPRFVVRGIPT